MNRSHRRAVCTIIRSVFVFLPFSASQSQTPPTLRLTSDLRIEAAEHDLSPITSLAVAPNGAIAITQNQDGSVRFFDSRGAALGTFGRKGQGPGEFMLARRLSWIADTLVVGDLSTRRYTLISPDRKLVRTVPWLSAVSMAPKSGGETPTIRGGLSMTLSADGSQLLPATVAEGSPQPGWPGGMKSGTPIVRVDSKGAFRRLIAWLPDDECTMQFEAGSFGFLVIPFCATPLQNVSADGSRLSIAHVEPGSKPLFRVDVFHTDGDTLFSRAYPYQPVTITKGAKDNAIAAAGGSDQARRNAAAKLKLPDTYPSLSRLVAGRDGTTWVEHYHVSGQRVWSVLDARGSMIGRVSVPANTRIIVASRTAVWAIEADNDGLESIVRFRVTR